MGDTIRTIFFMANQTPKEMYVTSREYDHLFSGKLQKIRVRSNYVLYFGKGDTPNHSVHRLFQQEIGGDALLVRTINNEDTEISL